MYLVFTRMPGESDHRRFRSLLSYLRSIFRVIFVRTWPRSLFAVLGLIDGFDQRVVLVLAK